MIVVVRVVTKELTRFHGKRRVAVRYHSGGSMELNASILLLAYMVYL
jgi:hypothetical protein